MTEQQPPPEAVLIERLRQQLPGGQSTLAHVAKHAGISESRWRQIALGYQKVDKDTRVRVVAPARRLARMARAVGATPEDLEEVGRSDAAHELSKLPSAASVTILDDLSDEDLLKELAKRLADRHGRRLITDEMKNLPEGSPPTWRLTGEEPGMIGNEDRRQRDEGVGG